MNQYDYVLWKPDLTIPKNEKTANQILHWYASDKELNSNHPIYKPNDIIYKFNSLGYRSCEFNDPSPKLLSIGCSTTFGVGLPKEEMFSEIIAKELNVVNCNISMPGKSNDYISRLLEVALPIIDPEYIVVNFTYMSRKEFWTNNGILFTYSQACRKIQPNEDIKYIYNEEYVKKLEEINNINENFSNFYKNFCFVKNLLKGRNWAFSCVEDYFENINCDKKNYVGVLEKGYPLARDGHPGKISNWNLSQKYLNFFKKNNYEKFN